MFLTKKSIPRRTILRGMSAAVALPLLDAMIPAASADAALANPRRVGFIYVPHGADMGSWTPQVDGDKLTLSPSLQALAPYKSRLTVITNLKRAGTVQEMHAAAASGWLSGAIPKATEGEDYEVGTTIDQVLARKIGGVTPLPSIEFATEDFTGYVGGCTPGYSCTYMNTISWSSPTTPLPMEINPRTAFERLFGDGGSQSQRLHQLQEDGSILDSILGEARRLQGKLGAPDRTRVGDYLDNIREIERRIQQVEAQPLSDIHLMDKPLGIPDSFEEHTALMFELLAMVYQADLARVFTFMMSREASQRTFPEIEVSDPWHVVSHHGNQPEKVARAAKVNALCVGMLAKFIDRLSTTSDGDGTLLDHTLLFYGSGMGNSNSHATDPLPMLAFGGGLKGNRHLVLPEKTEIGNLWLGLAHRYGEPLDRFGQSTGTVEL
jgi:Protein of unknown function (DUF1552)